MKTDFDIHKWQRQYILEGRVNGYQVVFHDYSGEYSPYTEQTFDSEIEAEKWALSQEWEEDVQDWEGNYSKRYRYYNPQENDSAFGYHIEKV